MIVDNDMAENMKLYASREIERMVGRTLVSGDQPYIAYKLYFPEYTGDEEKYYFWLGNE